MDKTSKRFDDWEVDCNECSHYWDNSCDGASKGSRIDCNSFLATRSIVIPERLNYLEKRVKWLELAFGICAIVIGTWMLVVYFNG